MYKVKLYDPELDEYFPPYEANTLHEAIGLAVVEAGEGDTYSIEVSDGVVVKVHGHADDCTVVFLD
jgi:hypothetical protein